MTRKSQFTIGRLMVVVGLFAILFALPSALAVVIGSLLSTGLFAQGSAVLLDKLVSRKPGSAGIPKNVGALTLQALTIDVIAWFLILGLVSFRWGASKEAFLTSILSSLVVAGIGTFALVASLWVMMSCDWAESRAWKIVSFLVFLTTLPFYFGFMLGLILLVSVIFR